MSTGTTQRRAARFSARRMLIVAATAVIVVVLLYRLFQVPQSGAVPSVGPQTSSSSPSSAQQPKPTAQFSEPGSASTGTVSAQKSSPAAAAVQDGPTSASTEITRVPADWRVSVPGPKSARSYFTLASDSRVVWHGSESASLTSRAYEPGQEPRAALLQIVDAAAFQGQRMQFSAHIRTARSAPEYRASLWVRAENDEGLVVAFQNMEKRMIKGDTEWSPYSLVLDIPSNATVLLYGAFVIGAGTLWIDDAAIGSVDRGTPLTDLPYQVSNGIVNLALDPSRILSRPENLDFEDTELTSDLVYWSELEQPTFAASDTSNPHP